MNNDALKAIRRYTLGQHREAKFLAEAKNILDKGEHIAMHIIVQLMKDAGWEPDDGAEGGWVKR